MNVLSLCSGVGGLDVGLKLATNDAARTVCYVERDAYCAEVLAARMGEGLDEAPIWSCVKSFDGRAWRGVVDCIIGGYPCQPFSCAGRRQGANDPRHLWPYFLRHIQTIEPAFVFCENVPGHLTMGFEQVCEDLQGLGYNIEAGAFSAAECGAQHLRQRLYFLAHAADIQPRPVRGAAAQGAAAAAIDVAGHGEDGAMAHATGTRRAKGLCSTGAARIGQSGLSQPQRRSDDVAYAHSVRCQQGGPQKLLHQWGHLADGRHMQPAAWPTEPDVDRVVDGLPHRVDRLRALGNAVVPATAALAWRSLYGQAMTLVAPL